MRRIATLVALVVPLAVAAAASGADAVRPLRVEVVPNYHAASVYAFYDGDADEDAVCHLQYRTGDDADWHDGHPLTRNGHTKTFPDTGRFAGSLFGLEPDRPLEVRVTFEDPDGLAEGASATLTAASRTRSDTFPTGSGKTYVVAPDGDDASPGTREKPFATIQHAVDLVEPGDTIYLKDGTYRESVTVTRSGRPDAYIRLAVDPKETAPPMHVSTMDGAGFVKRFHARAHLAGWVPAGSWEDLGEGLYACPEKRRVGTVTMTLSRPKGSYRPVGTRIYHHGSLKELKEAGPPLVPGWWQDEKAGRLYVRKPEGRPVTVAGVRLGVLPSGLKFENASHWIVEGLEFEVFGGGPHSRGIEVRGGEGIVIRGCRFRSMRTHVLLRKGAERCLVEACTFRDTGIWNWPWEACKSHDVEGCAVYLQGGSGNVVRLNHIEGLFNGIAPATWGDLHNDRINCDMDIQGNTFTHVADDCLEPEGACINVRFWDNEATDVFVGLSVAPVTVGPCWVVRDRYVRCRNGGLKLGVDTAGTTYVYHTLFWEDEGNDPTCLCGRWGNLHFRNSIFRAQKYAIEDYRHPHTAPVSFDYCCLWAERGTPFVKWEGKRYSHLADLPEEGGFGPHNLRDRPYTRVEAHRPMGLVPALIDAGVRLPGINDGFKGEAPDIGPEEQR